MVGVDLETVNQRRRHRKRSAEIIATQTVLLAFALIASGHLPLMMPLLGAAMLSATWMAAIAVDAEAAMPL